MCLIHKMRDSIPANGVGVLVMVLVGVGDVHGYMVGVIGDHIVIILLILDIGNSVKMVHGVPLLLVVPVKLVNTHFRYGSLVFISKVNGKRKKGKREKGKNKKNG